MTSTTSFREFMREWKALYGWNLRRSRGISLLYFGLIVLVGPVLAFLAGASQNYSMVSLRNMIPVYCGLTMPFTMAFVLVFSIQRFGYMHNKRSVDLYHSMPVRRVPMLLASWSAAVTGLLLPLLADIFLFFLLGLTIEMGDFRLLMLDYFRLFGSQMFLAVVCLTFVC